MSSGRSKLTKRGRRVLWALIILATVAITWATRDVCWTGAGYGSCEQWIIGNK